VFLEYSDEDEQNVIRILKKVDESDKMIVAKFLKTRHEVIYRFLKFYI
jgi:hypothetical protein